MASTQHRKNLRQWVLNQFGNGVEVWCEGCGDPLVDETMTLDRFPIPGYMGGSYRRGNVRPMCCFCNNSNAFTPSRSEVMRMARQYGLFIRPEYRSGDDKPWLSPPPVRVKPPPLTYRISLGHLSVQASSGEAF